MDKYSGCQASRNHRIITHSNSLRKVIVSFTQQLIKRRNSMCYKHCAVAICCFMSSNRHSAPLQQVLRFVMLDDVEFNHEGKQTYWCKVNETAYK